MSGVFTSSSAAFCWVCNKRFPGKPVSKGCSCRGMKSFAHIDCLVQHAVQKNEPFYWRKCAVCKQTFTVQVRKSLAVKRFDRFGDTESPEDKLSCLMHVGCAQLENDEPEQAFETFKKCVDICRKLYGDDAWNDNVVNAHTSIAYALNYFLGRHDEALEILELLQSKLTEKRIISWENPAVLGANRCLAATYMIQNEEHKALPILEKLVRSDSSCLSASDRIKYKLQLAQALFLTGAPTKVAYNMGRLVRTRRLRMDAPTLKSLSASKNMRIFCVHRTILAYQAAWTAFLMALLSISWGTRMTIYGVFNEHSFWRKR